MSAFQKAQACAYAVTVAIVLAIVVPLNFLLSEDDAMGAGLLVGVAIGYLLPRVLVPLLEDFFERREYR